MGIAVVAVVDIGEHSVEIGFLSLSEEFIETALCADFRRCGKEEFEFGIGENDRTDVSSVHDDTFGLSHGLLLCDEEGAYFADLGNTAGLIAHFECTDLRFDIFAVERDMLCAVHLDEAYQDMRQGGDDVSCFGEPVAKSI